MTVLESIYRKNKALEDKGIVADYIPELKKADIDHLGIALADENGLELVGDTSVKFTMQSVSKILSLALAIKLNGLDRVLEKVDIKPTTDQFNKFYKLDLLGDKKPSNPMINLGAIATTALIPGEDKIGQILDFVREITSRDDIDYNRDVYKSESETGFRNRSMAFMLKEIGNIEEDPTMVLENYFKQCSIELDLEDLVKIAYLFGNEGRRFGDEKQILDREIVSFINAVMLTSGMYNYSGEYAARVGLPSKSGVSGCILGVIPAKGGLAVYAPGLDEYGNSKLGLQVMADISKELNLSIF